MKKLLSIINPKNVISDIQKFTKILRNQKRYSRILNILDQEGKLKSIGLKKEGDRLYVGINLNPELLIYNDETQESAELKFISDKLKIYTDFMQKEGILDSVIADYDRVKDDDYYGYVVEIRFDTRDYSRSKFIYALSYFPTIAISISAIVALILR
jgi:hypothetical protein